MLRRLSLLTAVIIVGAGVASAGLFGLRGAKHVDAKFQAQRTVVEYEKGEGALPPDTEFLLVETEKGLAFYERDAKKGGGTLFEEQWLDDAGDLHFAGIQSAGGNQGFEFVIPADRTKPAARHYYKSLTGCRSFKIRGIVEHCQDKKTQSGTLIPKAAASLP